jgi:YesN/AraC family two-component response regulator
MPKTLNERNSEQKSLSEVMMKKVTAKISGELSFKILSKSFSKNPMHPG